MWGKASLVLGTPGDAMCGREGREEMKAAVEAVGRTWDPVPGVREARRLWEWDQRGSGVILWDAL